MSAYRDSRSARGIPANHCGEDVNSVHYFFGADVLSRNARTEDNEPRWPWWPLEQTVGFTRRMQTYEATMHRVDAELTAGLPIGPIAPDVAAGAIDHAVDVMWGWLPEGSTYEARAVVEFVASDADQRWLVEVGTASGSPRAVRSTVGEPTATVTAPVVDLALWAWTRGGSVEVSGDKPSNAALDAVVSNGMQ